MNLEDLPGIGPQLAVAIRRRFDGDAAFIRAAKSLDLAAIQEVEGLSPKRAIELVRHITGDGGADHFLATPAARKVHDEVMRRLLRFATTDHGRNRLQLLAPLASQEAATKRIQHIMAQKEAVANLDREAVRKAMRRLRPFQEPNPICDTTTLLVAANDDAYEHLHGVGAGRWCYLGTARDGQSSDAELIIAAGDLDLPTDIQIPEAAALADAAPQALLAWARANQGIIAACATLADLFGRPTVAHEVLESSTVPSGQPIDEQAVHQAIEVARKAADAAIEADLADLALPAVELMRALSTHTPPPAVRSVVEDRLREAAQSIRDATGCSLQPFEATFPVTVDEDEIERVLAEQRSLGRAQQFLKAQQAARTIAKHQEALAAELAGWFEFDPDFALGCFALHHDLHAPILSDRFVFEQSIHLALADQPNIQHIGYRLGDAEPLAVMTGANSGGKSTLLEHLAQLALMTRMGLPVVGQEVQVPWVDELHFVTARRGLDAGAFETFLRSFLPIASGDATRLVLADEVESVTELEAAGRILAFFLDRLAATDSLCVLVTHMSEAILGHVQTPVRVDGIDAVGLDENDELVVDRCPKMNHVARSTPELIVQRLAATTKGDDLALFKALHATLTDSETRK